jgi:hypothetical protein
MEIRLLGPLVGATIDDGRWWCGGGCGGSALRPHPGASRYQRLAQPAKWRIQLIFDSIRREDFLLSKWYLLLRTFACKYIRRPLFVGLSCWMDEAVPARGDGFIQAPIHWQSADT